MNNLCKCDRSDPAYFDDERGCPVVCCGQRRNWDAPDDQSFRPLWMDVRPGHRKSLIQDVVPWFNDEAPQGYILVRLQDQAQAI